MRLRTEVVDIARNDDKRFTVSTGDDGRHVFDAVVTCAYANGNRIAEGELAVLEVLGRAYPKSVERAALDDATGFKRSTRDAYLSRLSARRLIEAVGRGEVRAAEELFS